MRRIKMRKIGDEKDEKNEIEEGFQEEKIKEKKETHGKDEKEDGPEKDLEMEEG